MPSYGRIHVPETFAALSRAHLYKGAPLRAVDHEPKNDVLDQEDLITQGIKCSSFIPNAQDVNALGSCTANATVSGLSNVLDQASYLALTGASSYSDTAALEKYAIEFYHECTDQTGNPQQEWPPTDCGSSGPYVCQLLTAKGLISSDTIAHGATNIVSLMQTGGLIIGSPWFNAWETPNNNGFIDNYGTAGDLQSAINSGVAGGHETYWGAVEAVSVLPNGEVDPTKTIIRGRNSWSKSWGDNGDYRIHLSTFVPIMNYCDFRQLVA